MMSKPGRTKECAHGKSFSVSRRMAVSCASKSRISSASSGPSAVRNPDHAFEPLRSNRKVSVKRSRQTARSRIALQETRDAAHRCASLQEGRDAALARCDAGILGLGGSNGSAAAARALCPRKAAPGGKRGCGPMTKRDPSRITESERMPSRWAALLFLYNLR